MTWPQKPSNVVSLADYVQARLTRHLACLRDDPGLTDQQVHERLGYDERSTVRAVPVEARGSSSSPYEGLRPMDLAEFDIDRGPDAA